jgi:hypothetical protein
MDDSTVTQWLFDNGGPAIRYRTATELMDASAEVDRDTLASDLLSSAMVRWWLDRIGRPGGLTSLHGSHPDAFENVCAKLCELGLRAGMLDELDAKMQPFLQHLNTQDFVWGRTILAAGLNWLGFGDDEAVQAHLSERLDQMHELAHSGNYDLYIDQDTFGDFNNAFRKKSLINPKLNEPLPKIWDIYALAHWPEALMDDHTQSKIDTIIAYILHPDYQALEEGYGVMRAGKRRYYSMGWSVHLPGYAHSGGSQPEYTYVQRLELMAHFGEARNTHWFQDRVSHLETYRTDKGTYRFPAGYLRENSRGYWVTGAYMRLEENRRVRRSLDLDSTFRMCKIKSLVHGKGR